MAPVPGSDGLDERRALAFLRLAPAGAVECRDPPRRLFVILESLDPDPQLFPFARMSGLVDTDAHGQAPISVHSAVYPPAVVLFPGGDIGA